MATKLKEVDAVIVGLGWTGGILAIDRDHAREADQFPARFVAVAAVDRVREHAFHHGLIDRGPENPCRQPAVESELAG